MAAVLIELDRYRDGESFPWWKLCFSCTFTWLFKNFVKIWSEPIGEVCFACFLVLPPFLSQVDAQKIKDLGSIPKLVCHARSLLHWCTQYMCNANTFIQQHVNHHYLLPLSTSFADQRQVNKPPPPPRDPATFDVVLHQPEFRRVLPA